MKYQFKPEIMPFPAMMSLLVWTYTLKVSSSPMTEALEVPLKFGFDSRIKLPSWSNDSWKLFLFQVHSIPGKCKCFQCLFYVVPSSEETSFWPSSMVYISVIIFYTYYTLQIMLDILCGQLYMYCTLDTACLWDMGTPHDAILVFCGLCMLGSM